MRSVNDFSPYSNVPYGIDIQYPSNWTKVQGELVNSLLNGNNTNRAIVQFFSPDESVQLTIAVEKLAGITTLKQYTDSNIITAVRDNRAFITNIATDVSKTILGGMPAYKVVWSGNPDYEGLLFQKFHIPKDVANLLIPHLSYDLTMMQFDTIKDGNGYSIAYGSTPFVPNGSAHYYHYLPIAEKAIESLKIRK
jgi:hypothetical protein